MEGDGAAKADLDIVGMGAEDEKTYRRNVRHRSDGLSHDFAIVTGKSNQVGLR
jgi:hypothetical protein